MTVIAERPSTTSDAARQQTTTRRGHWFVAAGIPTVMTGFHATYYGQWIPDDAGLTFAYARSFASGAGPVLQPGADVVEGYSNPAWVAVLVVGRWLGLFDRGALFGASDVLMFPKLASLACCFGIFAAMYAIATKVTHRPALVTVCAGAATAVVPSFAIWSLSGMENALYALAVTAIAAVLARAAIDGLLLQRNTAVIAGLLAALAALTRPDGVVYVVALPLALALTMKRDTVRRSVAAAAMSLGAFAVPVLVYVIWRVVTFGDWLPNTARAKQQGGPPSLADLGRVGELANYVGWLAACGGVAVVAVVLSRRSQIRTVVLMLLIPLGLAALSFVTLRPDWMAQLRFATPVWPLASLVVTLSVTQSLRGTGFRERAVAVLLSAVVVATTLNLFTQWDKEFRAAPTVGLCNIAQNHGYLINGYADILGIRDGTLLSTDGGGTGLTSRLRFVDLAGLAHRRIARFWQYGDMVGLRDYVFDDVRPTFVKLFSGWAEREQLALAQDPRFQRDYELLFSGEPNSGEWVRRDAVPDRSRLDNARQWGHRSWERMNDRYWNWASPIWWCGDTLRPTPFNDGTPAPSPLTED